MNNWQLLLSELITFRTTNGFVVNRIQNVVHFTAEGNYAYIHLIDGQRFLVFHSLKAIEEMLPKEIMLRVHRCTLVNKLHVRKFVANGKLNLYLSNGHKVEVSHRKQHQLMSQF